MILAPVYYGCPLLCGQVLTGLTRGLKPLVSRGRQGFRRGRVQHQSGRRRRHWLLSKRTAYLERYDRPGSESGWHFLTGEAGIDHARWPRRSGFATRCNPQTKLYTHAAGVVVVTPEGVVSRYFFGIDYPPKELQLELERASAGRVGSPIGKLLLLCYDYDAATGKYTLSILRLMRVLGTATAVSLGGLCVRDDSPRGEGAPVEGPCERDAGDLDARWSPTGRELTMSSGEARIMWDFPLFPDQASSLARQVDELYLFELGIAGFFTVLICLLIVSFADSSIAGARGRTGRIRRLPAG